MSDSMTLAELADASGLPARTIRFYIARRVLNGPVKAGRGAVYGPEHLERLQQIQRLQAEGRTIAEIGRTLDGNPPEFHAQTSPAAWWQHVVADDVTVWVRDGLSPWRTRQIRAAIGELAGRLRTPFDEARKEQGDQ
ncbi:MAG TPA: helix-turn-helix domain-containing protein [Bryobacteraceae bacterium]|jgi:DNA-binding transcriptional MerR regulator|nr:helix-turn-helix domain-containing protein [Bryobacteraceae bacterium]